MPSNPRTLSKPLFSRTQLNWIIIILSAVIALLSLAPAPPPWPTLVRSQIAHVPLLHPLARTEQPLQIRLSLLLPPQLDAASPLATTLASLLSTQLRPLQQTGDTWQQQRHPDRVQLTVTAPSTHALSALLLQLQKPPSTLQFAEAERQLTAALRLAHHAQPQPLWPLGLENNQLEALYRNWLSRAQLRLTATAPLESPWLQTLTAGLNDWPAGTPWSVDAPRLVALQQHSPAPRHQLRLLRQLPGRETVDYDSSALLVHWLRLQAQAADITLDWQPRRGGSRLSLQAETSQPISASELLAPLQPIDAHSLSQLAQRLETQLQQRRDQPLGWLDLLETLSAYDLPLDALPRFAATIAALQEENSPAQQQFFLQLAELLHPEAFIQIQRTPIGANRHDASPTPQPSQQ